MLTEMDVQKIIAHSAAMNAVLAAERAGDVDLTHADLDKANRLALDLGLPPVAAALSDIQIRANAPGKLGEVAQLVSQGSFPVKINGVEVQLSNVAVVKPVLEPLVAQVPTPAPAPTAFVPIYLPGPLPGLTEGVSFPDAGGNKWVYGRLELPFGVTYYIVRVAAALLLAVLLLAAPMQAQVTIACSPQPMAATHSIGEKVMGPYQCWITNDGTAAYTLTPSKFYQALMPLRPVGPQVANQIITDSINRLPQSRALQIGKIAANIGAVAYGIYAHNYTVPLAVGLGVQNAPQLLSIIEGTVPSGTPFSAPQFMAAVTIPPGGDVPPVVIYAMKTKTPAPLTVVLPAK
jgi:hypothetical protein